MKEYSIKRATASWVIDLDNKLAMSLIKQGKERSQAIKLGWSETPATIKDGCTSRTAKLENSFELTK